MTAERDRQRFVDALTTIGPLAQAIERAAQRAASVVEIIRDGGRTNGEKGGTLMG